MDDDSSDGNDAAIGVNWITRTTGMICHRR